MPRYDYQCKTCGVFELFQSMNDAPLKKCPTCKKAVTRLIGTGAGIVFKGSGFYQTDYKRGPAPSEKPAAKPADKPAEKSSVTPKPSKDKKEKKNASD